MQYIVMIQNNAVSQASPEDWSVFFDKATASAMFKGGSEMLRVAGLGNPAGVDTSAILGGFMRFDTDSIEALRTLLLDHPVVKHGGSLEIYEMPTSQ